MAETPVVRLLADVPQTIPTLAGWYKNEWTAWFATMSLSEIEADFASLARRERLPFAVVAFAAAGQPIGVCSVRADAFESYPGVGPWLRGLYVTPEHRGDGIAGELLSATAQHATFLGIDRLYAATHSAIGTFERAGWLGFDQVQHDGRILTIFAKRTS